MDYSSAHRAGPRAGGAGLPAPTASAAPDRLRVRINVPVLRENLADLTGRSWCDAEVLAWLVDAGFSKSDGGTWLVREVDLGQLESTEVGIVADEN
jgi:hypothetical protein